MDKNDAGKDVPLKMGDKASFIERIQKMTQAEKEAAIAKTRRSVGDRMPDGSIYAGISPDTHLPLYVAAEDLSLRMIFVAAVNRAEKFHAHGHMDWRLPSRAELDMLYRARNEGALKGTFNVTATPIMDDWYWSSTPVDNSHCWSQRFSDSGQDKRVVHAFASVRYVR